MSSSHATLRGVGLSSASLLGQASGHAFKKTYFKKFTWCAHCGDFIWGVHEPQGYLCKVCGIAVHKKCLKKADSLTHCSEALSKEKKSGKSSVQKMAQQKLEEKLLIVANQIKESVYVEPFRIESFLALVSALEDGYDDNTKYRCFVEHPVPNDALIRDSSDAPQLKHCLSVDLRADPLACLVGWIIEAPHDVQQTCAAIALEHLLTSDETRVYFMTRKYAHELARLLSFDKEHPPDSFRHIVKCLRAISALHEAVSPDLLRRKTHEQRLRFLVPFPNSTECPLSLVISFLLKLSKVKIRQVGQYKDSFKVERAHVAETLREGSQLVASIYTDPDRSFMSFIDAKRGLSIVLMGTQLGVVELHKEISSSEVVFGKPLYESILCTVCEGVYNGVKVACKRFNPKGLGFTWESFRQEVSLLASVQHPNVCRLFGACTKEEEAPFLLMQLFSRGSIKDVARVDGKISDVAIPTSRTVIDTSLLVNMAMNAANGIAHLHSKNIIHRDIKPGNFLVDEHFGVFVIDFGVSRVSTPDPTEKMTLIGTPTYMAPEVLDGLPYDGKADTYSFVLVLWSMLTGEEPFSGIDSFSIADEVVNHDKRPVIPPGTDPTLAKLITEGWNADPFTRPDFNEILDVLYNMKDPVTHRYYCRVWEALSDEQIVHLYGYLDPHSRASFASTCKRIHAIIQNTRKKGDQRRSTFAVTERKSGKSPLPSPRSSPSISTSNSSPPPRPKRDTPRVPTSKTQPSGLGSAHQSWVSGTLIRSAPKKLQQRSHSTSESEVGHVSDAGNSLAPPLSTRGKSPRTSPRGSPRSSPAPSPPLETKTSRH